jgi:hypothetical protein
MSDDTKVKIKAEMKLYAAGFVFFVYGIRAIVSF